MNTVDDEVREVVQSFVNDGALFTALDVSNKVKENLPLARHREVRDLVRSSFNTDMGPAGYARTPITVTLKDGSTAEAILYHPLSDSWDLDAKYQSRAQASVQPVRAAQAAFASTPTVPAPPPPASNTTPTIPAPAGNARGLWDALFGSQPSLFPRH